MRRQVCRNSKLTRLLGTGDAKLQVNKRALEVSSGEKRSMRWCPQTTDICMVFHSFARLRCSSTLLPNIVIAQYVPGQIARPCYELEKFVCPSLKALRQAEIGPSLLLCLSRRRWWRSHACCGGEMCSPTIFSPSLETVLRGQPSRMPGPYRRRFLDSWRADDNVGFSATAMMRYRSRRDMLAMLMDPAFADGHIYKLAAIERTINYPANDDERIYESSILGAIASIVRCIDCAKSSYKSTIKDLTSQKLHHRAAGKADKEPHQGGKRTQNHANFYSGKGYRRKGGYRGIKASNNQTVGRGLRSGR